MPLGALGDRVVRHSVRDVHRAHDASTLGLSQDGIAGRLPFSCDFLESSQSVLMLLAKSALIQPHRGDQCSQHKGEGQKKSDPENKKPRHFCHFQKQPVTDLIQTSPPYSQQIGLDRTRMHITSANMKRCSVVCRTILRRSKWKNLTIF